MRLQAGVPAQQPRRAQPLAPDRHVPAAPGALGLDHALQLVEADQAIGGFEAVGLRASQVGDLLGDVGEVDRLEPTPPDQVGLPLRPGEVVLLVEAGVDREVHRTPPSHEVHLGGREWESNPPKTAWRPLPDLKSGRPTGERISSMAGTKA